MSFLNYEIRTIFDKKINETYKNRADVVSWLINHDRKKLCIENLETEIIKAELAMAGKFKKKQLDWVVESYANTFMEAAIKLKKQEAMHYLDQQKIVDKHKEHEEIMQMFESEDSSESL